MSHLLGRRLVHVASADWAPVQVRTALRHHTVEDAVGKLEARASDLLGIDVVAFGSARAALAAALLTAPRRLQRVIVPAYTCVAVPNAVRAAAMEVRWVDIDSGPNLGLSSLEEILATPGPLDAAIVQHTYGIPTAAGAMQAISDHGGFVIEDRAHMFDAKDLEGDCAVYSLEHSKLVSASQGGLAWARDSKQRARLREMRDRLPPVSDREAARALRTSAIQSGLAHLDALGRGSSLLRRFALRFPPTSHRSQNAGELTGGPADLVSLHPALASVGLQGLANVTSNLRHRRRVASIYRRLLPGLVPIWAQDDLPYVRQPVLVPDAEQTTAALRRSGLDLGERWFNAPIHPRGSHSTYVAGTAPNAENLARHVLSLPTHPLITSDTAEVVALSLLTALR